MCILSQKLPLLRWIFDFDQFDLLKNDKNPTVHSVFNKILYNFLF